MAGQLYDDVITILWWCITSVWWRHYTRTVCGRSPSLCSNWLEAPPLGSTFGIIIAVRHRMISAPTNPTPLTWHQHCRVTRRCWPQRRTAPSSRPLSRTSGAPPQPPLWREKRTEEQNTEPIRDEGVIGFECLTFGLLFRNRMWSWAGYPLLYPTWRTRSPSVRLDEG